MRNFMRKRLVLIVTALALFGFSLGAHAQSISHIASACTHGAGGGDGHCYSVHAGAIANKMEAWCQLWHDGAQSDLDETDDVPVPPATDLGTSSSHYNYVMDTESWNPDIRCVNGKNRYLDANDDEFEDQDDSRGCDSGD